MKTEEAIERLQELIEYKEEWREFWKEKGITDYRLCDTELDLEMLRMAVRALQNRDIPVHVGRWKTNKDYVSDCSACGYMPMFDSAQDDFYYSPYCPNCGAAMTQEGVKEDRTWWRTERGGGRESGKCSTR